MKYFLSVLFLTLSFSAHSSAITFDDSLKLTSFQKDALSGMFQVCLPDTDAEMLLTHKQGFGFQLQMSALHQGEILTGYGVNRFNVQDEGTIFIHSRFAVKEVCEKSNKLSD